MRIITKKTRKRIPDTLQWLEYRGKINLIAQKMVSQCKKSSCIYSISFMQYMFSFWSEKWSGFDRFYEIHLDIMNTIIWHRKVKILSVVLPNVCQRTPFKSLEAESIATKWKQIPILKECCSQENLDDVLMRVNYYAPTIRLG